MGKLEGAVPGKSFVGTAVPVKSERGIYPASWMGISDAVENIDQWGEKCRLCKGNGTGYNGEGKCRVCGGHGKKVDKKARLLYRLDNGTIEEEEVNYLLTPPRTGGNGQPLSPSKLYTRLSELANMQAPSVEDLDAWFTGLPNTPGIRCQVLIGLNQSQKELCIANVLLEKPGSGGAAPAANAATSFSDPETTKVYEPGALGVDLNNEIVDLARNKLGYTIGEWKEALAKHTGGELVVGKTKLSDATLLRDYLKTQWQLRNPAPAAAKAGDEDEIPF